MQALYLKKLNHGAKMAPSILLFYFIHGPLGAMEEWASFADRLDPPSALCRNLENEKKN